MIKRNKYTPEMKKRLVIELLSKESSGAKICQRERIAYSTLTKWRNEIESGEPLNGEDSESVRLRRENQDLKNAVADLTLQVQVLKKLETVLSQMRKNGELPKNT